MVTKISPNRKGLRQEVPHPDRSVEEMTAAVREFLRLARQIYPLTEVVVLKNGSGAKLKLRLT